MDGRHVHWPVHPLRSAVNKEGSALYTITDLFDLNHTLAKEYLSRFTDPWEALGGIRDLIGSLGKALPADEYAEIAPWEHLDYGVTKEYLVRENRTAHSEITTPNCREKCAGCGANCYGEGVCFENR